MGRIYAQLLLAALGLARATLTPADIFARQTNTCAAGGFSPCVGAPAGFCCGPNVNCILLAGNTTVLCCPSGNTCPQIQPIPCDLSLQNNTLHPDNALKTTALTGTLPVCAGLCCPFGFSCSGNGVCQLDTDQSKAPSTSAVPVPSSTSAPSSTAPTQSSGSSTTPASQSSTPTNAAEIIPVACTSFPTPAVLAGFFPGLAAGVLLTVLTICLLGAKRRRAARRDSGSSFGNNISDPQPVQGGLGDRTDFLRKVPQTPSSSGGMNSRSGTIRRVKSLFRKSTSTAGGSGSTPGSRHHNHAPIPLMAQRGEGGLPMHQQQQQQQTMGGPYTPPLQRDPSFEQINIFADNDTASALRERARMHGTEDDASPTSPMKGSRDTAGTSFAAMMKSTGLAGLQAGERKFS